MKVIQVKNSLLSASSLASITYTPSVMARAAGQAPRPVRPVAIPVTATSVLAASLATILAGSPTPAAATVVLSGTNYSNGNFVIGDRVSSGIGYTLVDGTGVSRDLLAKRNFASSVTTSVTVAAPGNVGLSVSGVASTISGRSSDSFTVDVKPTVTGALTNTFNYRSQFNSTSSVTTVVTVKTTGVAPLASVTSGLTITTRAGAASGTANLTVQNIGNGNRNCSPGGMQP